MATENSHVYLALVHYPVYDKNGRVVATSITNYDIHDISRVVKTYALGGYYMVTPLVSQQDLCRRIIRHWVEGFGSRYNQTRQAAFATTYLADSLRDVSNRLAQQYQTPPTVVITSAREHIASDCGKALLSYQEATNYFQDNTRPALLVFGTGYGITTACIREHGTIVLAPVRGIAGYNHLSVRSAAAIIVDRLFGRQDPTTI